MSLSEEAEVHRTVGVHDAALVQENDATMTYSDDDIKEALLRGVELLGEPLTTAGYDSVRAQFDGPSSARVIQRFTTWIRACDFAGAAHGQPRRAEYKRRWTDTEMLDWASAYFATEDCRGTYKDFSVWAASTPGAPSAQTVRNKLGSWATVKSAALAPATTPESRGGAGE